MSSDSTDKKVVVWQEALKVSMSLFMPAFALIVVSFIFLKPALGRTYTNEEINKQVTEQAEKVAKEEIGKAQGEISKLKEEISKLKGDLIGQITYPVIFAIASIFATFAVKDIVTKVWDRQEMTKLENALIEKLETNLVPNAIKKNQENLIQRFQDLEENTSWLEHQILSIFIAQMIDELRDNPALLETELNLSLVVDKLHNRSVETLKRSSNQFHRKTDIHDIKKFENILATVLGAKVEKRSLDEKDFEGLKEGTSSDGSGKSEFYQGQSLFHIQMRLIRNTLSKLPEDIIPLNQKKLFLDEIDRVIMTDPRRVLQESEKLTAKICEKAPLKTTVPLED